MNGRPALLLFARAPEPGRVKTRLTPALTAPGASELYRAFLRDAARLYARGGRWRSVLCADPKAEDPRLAEIFSAPWERRSQGPGDLGERLQRAFGQAFAAGAPAAVALGSDHPTLPLRRLEEVFAALASEKAAIVPAEDGGYCALGLSSGASGAGVFRDVPWSTGDVLETTLARLHAAGLSCRLLEPFYDVDRPEDLERLRRDLSARDPEDEDFPAATAACLAALPGFGGRDAR